MAVTFTPLDEDTVDGLASWVSENAEQFVRSLFDGTLVETLNEATDSVQNGTSVSPKQAEPSLHSVVSFANTSPSDNIRRSYSANRTRSGWQTSSGTSRLPKTDATWAQIVNFADGDVEVLREGAVN